MTVTLVEFRPIGSFILLLIKPAMNVFFVAAIVFPVDLGRKRHNFFIVLLQSLLQLLLLLFCFGEMLLLTLYKLLQVSGAFVWGFVYVRFESAVSHHSEFLLLFYIFYFFESTRLVFFMFLQKSVRRVDFSIFWGIVVLKESQGCIGLIPISFMKGVGGRRSGFELARYFFHIIIGVIGKVRS